MVRRASAFVDSIRRLGPSHVCALGHSFIGYESQPGFSRDVLLAAAAALLLIMAQWRNAVSFMRWLLRHSCTGPARQYVEDDNAKHPCGRRRGGYEKQLN